MERATRALLGLHALFELGVAGMATLAPARLGAVTPEAVALARVLGANALGLAALGVFGARAARVPRVLLLGLACFHGAVVVAQAVNASASLTSPAAVVPHVLLAVLLGAAWSRDRSPAERGER